jgi:hypothetical protein
MLYECASRNRRGWWSEEVSGGAARVVSDLRDVGCAGRGRGGITEPTPLLAVSPQHVEFGTVLTARVTWQEVTLTDSGSADVELQAVSLQPDARGAFELSSP